MKVQRHRPPCERRRRFKLAVYGIGWVVLIALVGALLIGGMPLG
jgi:hypothetical protein